MAECEARPEVRGGRGAVVSVGVLLPADTVPRWVVMLLDDVQALPGARLDWVALPAPAGGRGAPASRNFSRALDRAVFAHRAGAVEPVGVSAWATTGAVAGGRPGRERPVTLLRGSSALLPADVLVDLSGGRLAVVDPGPASRTLRLAGVDPGAEPGTADAVVTAVRQGEATVVFALEDTRAGAGGGCTVIAGVCPVHPSSPLLTEAYLGASARQLIVRCIENHSPAVRADGDRRATYPDRTSRSDGGASSSVTARPSAPDRSSALRGARTVARTMARQVRKALWEPEWCLLVGRQPQERLLPDPRQLRAILPPRGAYWADPHLVDFEGATYVFFEEFDYRLRRGRIAVSRLDAAGVPGPPATALELDSHLSYPSVFVHKGSLWMVPECAASGRLDLYECTDPPRAWAFRRTLLAGSPLVDASFVQWGGRWWLFASLKKPPGLRTAELLLLFSADDPVTGTWTEHPRSPLCADVTDARPAGAPWVHDGRLYRPAQDGSRGYGSGVVVNEVTELAAGRYGEQRIAELEASWARGLCGAHTIGRVGDSVVMDACRWVWREPGRPRTDALID